MQKRKEVSGIMQRRMYVVRQGSKVSRMAKAGVIGH